MDLTSKRLLKRITAEGNQQGFNNITFDELKEALTGLEFWAKSVLYWKNNLQALLQIYTSSKISGSYWSWIYHQLQTCFFELETDNTTKKDLKLWEFKTQ